VGGGAPILREGPEKFFGRAPPIFGSKSTISRFGERFRDGQYSLVSFFFAIPLLTVPPCVQPFAKVGARGPRPPWSRRHCMSRTFMNLCLLSRYSKPIGPT